MVETVPSPKPLMFVSRDLDHKWIGNYMKKKHMALSQFIGKQETTALYYSLQDFAELIDRISAVKGAAGVKVYFASYCPTGVKEIDSIAQSGWMDQLTLVFAATDKGRNDLGEYLFISPSGGVLSLTKETATTLVQCYQTKKMPFLITVINDAGLPNFRETRSFWYSLEKFNGPYDIIKEMRLNDAAGITAFIGSYGEKETTPKGKDLSWQLNVVFELAKAVEYGGATHHYHFDLENTPGWADRPAAPQPDDTLEGGDTANPCPPAVCGSGLP
jgi:hypothetical protein